MTIVKVGSLSARSAIRWNRNGRTGTRLSHTACNHEIWSSHSKRVPHKAKMRQNFHSESTINKQVFLDLDISYGANDCVGGGWTALKVTHILKGAKKN